LLVLRHDHSPTFAKNLQVLRDWVQGMGYEERSVEDAPEKDDV